MITLDDLLYKLDHEITICVCIDNFNDLDDIDNVLHIGKKLDFGNDMNYDDALDWLSRKVEYWTAGTLDNEVTIFIRVKGYKSLEDY